MKSLKIENIAESLAIKINKNYPESSSVAVLKFGLIGLLNLLFSVIIVLLIGGLTDHFSVAVLAVLGFPLLRYYSGGIHFSSANLCSLVTSFFMLISMYYNVEYWYNGLILNVISIILLLLYAPAGIKKSNIKKEHYPRLKFISALIVLSNLFFQSEVLTTAFFIQSITTTPVVQGLVRKINL
ncbi:accessory gene regulator B family protein [Paenibacillus oleatilyticus]|uniref:accessory gene regulator B family protein n=1 Tax=Paenibacillus oleatilyticus TaxID=2594886 RepID=UPI001C1F2F5A|nr:accessory gene regulator B family protein [Paenibacillus oleatilyticus]MBU7319041.1 accessory gene regulator B family protein [Paenibacillus oleatilyticus]